ncbi:hypothetical protein CONPUDRAFT_76342 [Coniophora puteana RWD-64-598 SS2]|uniref:Uncharacterized protein n=1 Tax=Coniophora puteana (strain RWD-64-598) TaxID=741705 RepID=A0A5M3MCY0_CONPW|nr:uncharacterized protein CONPUDRAFT_76342 [Coniophora puteana RWD-64-598 SS2]EIW76744.1 hypothetical protein CONPUDRAFT_76342 [Coniophora puteana RWD-64-598 SS2]
MQKVCEMVCSGEILATVIHLLNVYSDNIDLGQDMGCAFSKTAFSSPLLCNKVHNQNLKICVNGLNLHFQQWDEDRYAKLSTPDHHQIPEGIRQFRTLMEDIHNLCQRPLLDIRWICDTHHRTQDWVAIQVYMRVGQEPCNKVKANRYSVFIKDEYATCVSNSNGDSLAHSVAGGEGGLDQMLSTKPRRGSPQSQPNEQAKQAIHVAEITQNTSCNMLYLVTHDKVTLEEMTMHLDVYVTGKILQTRGILLEKFPCWIEWANYNKLVLNYGVELHRFPGGIIKNPNNITTCTLLSKIEATLREDLEKNFQINHVTGFQVQTLSQMNTGNLWNCLDHLLNVLSSDSQLVGAVIVLVLHGDICIRAVFGFRDQAAGKILRGNGLSATFTEGFENSMISTPKATSAMLRAGTTLPKPTADTNNTHNNKTTTNANINTNNPELISIVTNVSWTQCTNMLTTFHAFCEVGGLPTTWLKLKVNFNVASCLCIAPNIWKIKKFASDNYLQWYKYHILDYHKGKPSGGLTQSTLPPSPPVITQAAIPRPASNSTSAPAEAPPNTPMHASAEAPMKFSSLGSTEVPTNMKAPACIEHMNICIDNNEDDEGDSAMQPTTSIKTPFTAASGEFLQVSTVLYLLQPTPACLQLLADCQEVGLPDKANQQIQGYERVVILPVPLVEKDQNLTKPMIKVVWNKLL